MQFDECKECEMSFFSSSSVHSICDASLHVYKCYTHLCVELYYILLHVINTISSKYFSAYFCPRTLCHCVSQFMKTKSKKMFSFHVELLTHQLFTVNTHTCSTRCEPKVEQNKNPVKMNMMMNMNKVTAGNARAKQQNRNQKAKKKIK